MFSILGLGSWEREGSFVKTCQTGFAHSFDQLNKIYSLHVKFNNLSEQWKHDFLFLFLTNVSKNSNCHRSQSIERVVTFSRTPTSQRCYDDDCVLMIICLVLKWIINTMLVIMFCLAYVLLRKYLFIIQERGAWCEKELELFVFNRWIRGRIRHQWLVILESQCRFGIDIRNKQSKIKKCLGTHVSHTATHFYVAKSN